MSTPTTSGGFAALGLSDPIRSTLDELGYEEPTPIQQMAIPVLLAGHDLLGQAATGTGKTAAFALPLLERIANAERDARGAKPEVRALVLVPTRELAMQVAEAIHRYGRGLGIVVLPIYGGAAMDQQLRALRRGVDVVVATPGRAVDHLQRKTLNLRSTEIVVLDEADEMLDMGFAEDLEAILSSVPSEHQTALFSATMAPRIASLAERHLRKPQRITIERTPLAEGEAPRVRQLVYLVNRRDKIAALARVLDMENPTSAIVFCRTRTEVDDLTEKLGGHGYRAEALHGGFSQDQRTRVMSRFRSGSADLLVATDVAARGIDIEHVSHVVNFDVPSAPDAYVHRIGRTARAGRLGTAVTFAEPRERRLLRNIEQHTGQKMQVEPVPTVMDLHARKLDLTTATLREALLGGELEKYAVVVEALSHEFDVMDIATAAVKIAHESSVGSGDTVEIQSVAPGPAHDEKPTRKHERAPKGRDSGPRRDQAPRRDKAAKAPRDDVRVVRLYVGIGRKAGIRPADLVGAIANETGLSARAIGAIEITDRFSLVEVPEDAADDIVSVLRGTTLRGKKVPVRREREDRHRR